MDMDWLERWLGWAPDNGDGSIETMLVAAAAVSACILFVAFYGPARRVVLERLGARATRHVTRR